MVQHEVPKFIFLGNQLNISWQSKLNKIIVCMLVDNSFVYFLYQGMNFHSGALLIPA